MIDHICTNVKYVTREREQYLRKIKKNTFFLFFKKTLLYSHIFH